MPKGVYLLLKIAVCDDDAEFIKLFGKKLREKTARFSEDFSVTEYVSGEKCIGEIDNYDAVFLDIDMPDISGLDIADYINKNSHALIIFVSSHDELVYSSIRFQPFRFLRKSHLDDELDEAVKSVCERLAAQKITILTKSGETVLDLNRLIYIEVFSHRLIFHSDGNEALQSNGSLSACEKKAEFGSFLRVHNSYLVNSKYVYSIETSCVVLDDKTEIPLSRHRAENVKKQFSEYLRTCL